MAIRSIALLLVGVALLLAQTPVGQSADACGKGTNTCKPNGCGPDGFWGKAVPDQVFSLCNFRKSCNHHDKCYSRCAKCGDLHGCKTCGKSKNSKERLARKRECDEQLRKEIDRENRNKPLASLCRGFGNTYKFAVKNAGGGYWNGKPLPPEFRRAIRDEFRALENIHKYASQHPGTVDLKSLNDRLDERLISKGGGSDFLNLILEDKQLFVFMVDLDRGKPVDLTNRLVKGGPRFETEQILEKWKNKYFGRGRPGTTEPRGMPQTSRPR